MLSEKWRITLLNGLEVNGNGKRIDRFRGRTTAELLALLALNSHRFVAREEIAGIIWPESDTEAARAGLRTALASLRAQLEPPGTISNSVLIADRTSIRLCQDAFTADVTDFKSNSTLAERANSPEQRIAAAIRAVDLYAGEFLPGNYSEWVLVERDNLHQLFQYHLAKIVAHYRYLNQPSAAIPYASRLIDENRFDEEAYLLTIRVSIEAGSRDNALQCFERLTRAMKTEFQTEPSEAAMDLRRLALQLPAEIRSHGLVQKPGARRPPVPITLQVHPETSNQRPSDSDNLQAVALGMPIHLTRFFGRDTEIMHLVRMLCPDSTDGMLGLTAQRLITLTGTGGTGKTRLATEVCSFLNAQRKMRVSFVPLADVYDPGRVLDAIATALKIVLRVPDDLIGQIVTVLSDQPHTIILDNFEQLLAPAANDISCAKRHAEIENPHNVAVEIVVSLLKIAPGLRFLVTSRQSLGVEGEQEYPLHPLAAPVLSATPERLLDFASVKLFVDRAQLSRPDFQLTTRNADVISSICTQLDGLPLAIELAAAWSSSLSPSQILDRLARRFDLLIGRKHGRAARHASLRAALEWSYHLLTFQQQQFFSRLSVFRGSWAVQAAAQVCEDPHALETLAALRDRSLIVMDELSDSIEDALRYRMLESLRQYSAEQLSVEDTSAARRRHLEWYAGWTDGAHSHWSGRDQQLWLQRVQVEQENIRAALEFSLNDADRTSACIGMRIMANLGHFWGLRGNITDARKLFKQFLDHPSTQEPNMERAGALMYAGSLASFQEDWKLAGELYKQSLNITRSCEPLRIGSAQLSLGNVAFASGEMDLARHYYEEGLISYKSAGSAAGIAAAYGALGEIAMTDGDFDTAIDSVRKAVELNRAQNNLSGVTHHLKQLAICYAKAGQLSEAYGCLAESLEGYHALKDLRGIAELFIEALDVIPLTFDSVCLLGAAHSVNALISARPRANQRLINLCRDALGDRTFDAAWEKGRFLSTDEAVELARDLFTVDRAFNTLTPGL